MSPVHYQYLPDGVSFASTGPVPWRTVYFPLCGTNAASLKSSITPFLSGDIKVNKDQYVTKPVSAEDLRQPLRDFFCAVKGKGVFSLSDEGAGAVTAGLLWHKVTKTHPAIGLEMTAVNFIPVKGDDVELMKVTLKNTGAAALDIIPTSSLPLFARALANKHDHEHVTSLLHRIMPVPQGVQVSPTMVFDERGHRANRTLYFVFGAQADGGLPTGSFPTLDSFLGDGGTLQEPEAVYKDLPPPALSGASLQGKEACGALRFPAIQLKPQETKEYVLTAGAAPDETQAARIFQKYSTAEKFDRALVENKRYWDAKTGTIRVQTGDPAFDAWMRWVTLQPVLRRIFGCSFLPDHDYGKGGKGWRDLWQDLLSLILIEPEHVRDALINNFGGVRIDGSNATIIGSAPGEFIADRNDITRVWMDHGAWPLATLLLYIHQTGDHAILQKRNTYFRDRQWSRGKEKDPAWRPGDGHTLVDKTGKEVKGSVLEHLLVQHLVQFFNVGRHNMIRLECADWNDGLDMAEANGESVAFTSFYGGNLFALADLLETVEEKEGIKEYVLMKELTVLLDSLTTAKIDYDVPAQKQDLLKKYFRSVQPVVSGATATVKAADLIKDLRAKGQWIFDRVRQQEKVTVAAGGQEQTWMNGYYDNTGSRVEGAHDGRVRMTLTGQVFAVMSGLLAEEDVRKVIKAVDFYLKDKTLGGYRLNTDFGLPRYLDLGRAFGFAYGTKENGAFFSHMTVMYASALYQRGFVREGYTVLQSIYAMCRDSEKSKIYPGIPEYFDGEGRGRYHYLTGSASWFVLAIVTQAFGVRGNHGDLVLAPRLVQEQFDSQGLASLLCSFAGSRLTVRYINKSKLEYGRYTIAKVHLNGQPVDYKVLKNNQIRVSRETLTENPAATLEIFLQ